MLPLQVAPSQRDEEAELSDATQQLLDREEPQQPAKVVHLPPQDVQEQRLRERKAEAERRKSESDPAKPHRLLEHQAPVPNELASSPSSTVGPYSAATPVLPQDSPDTSPDSEPAQGEVLPPKDLRPSLEQVREKEEHDRILEAQKEIARKQALGDVSTPDEQLRWEEKEAAAREAEEKSAREEVNGPEPDVKDAIEATAAENAVRDMEVRPDDARITEPTESETVSGQKRSSDTPTAEQDLRLNTEIDGDDNATADQQLQTPRNTGSVEHNAVVETSEHVTPDYISLDRMTTRVSSGAVQRKSVSEILGQTPSRALRSPHSMRTEVPSPGSVSPMSRRHPQDTTRRLSTTNPQGYTPRPLSQPCPTSPGLPVLDELDVLKGAADDPDKDYLEPLFRIQAHDSPNSRTRPLTELIKLVPKALSTEDQFINLHERLDYRILRRIYQLQNANKWSLRQMEKCAEPEQVLTHHDHMMAEMKWMRKDFNAERKMKKNICAWLAQRCAEWVAAGAEEKKRLQVTVKSPPSNPTKAEEPGESLPELETFGESAPEDETAPSTPKDELLLPTGLVVPPGLFGALEELQKAGKLAKALQSLPKIGLVDSTAKHEKPSLTSVSKFVEGKVLPKLPQISLKRSRYDYEDEAELLDAESSHKRQRQEQESAPEDQECALFQRDNKPIRDRLHSNNAFRPPSEFLMPTTSFYELRNGSQWIWEDDQKLRKLAKEYSFNWSLIADEMALTTRYKSSAERRTPWECFERWVELESLPADMRKTVYFRTWFQRLEQSQQAAERRYQAQVAAIQQQQAQTGSQTHVPLRRRTVPTRVEKRRSTRYLWMVDGFRQLAKKREQQAWKQAESRYSRTCSIRDSADPLILDARAAAQRKSMTESTQPRQVKMTPQEFSKKRHERDLQIQDAQRQQHRQKMVEAQQRQIQMARAAQQHGMQNGMTAQQRPQGTGVPAQQAQMQGNGQQMTNMSAQMAQPARTAQQIPMRNGLLAVPQVSAQGIPQAQMQQARAMAQHPSMQQMAQAQARNAQYPGPQYQMPNGNMPSPNGSGMTTQQQLQNNQALVAAFNAQQQAVQNNVQMQNMNSGAIPASPIMPPPPAPQNGPQQLSSGHVPQIIAIKNQLRSANPGLTEEQLNALATQQMKNQSTNQARQNAMNAAAGIPTNTHGNMQAYAQNRAAYQGNSQMTNGLPVYMNSDGTGQQANMGPANTSPQQAAYAHKMWQRQRQQMQMQSPNTTHATLAGSPNIAHASPSMAPASPSMQYANMNQMAAMGAPMASMGGQRPPSRSNTPQMQRLGSSGSAPGATGMNGGMQSPGNMQGSPRNMQASMAR